MFRQRITGNHDRRRIEVGMREKGSYTWEKEVLGRRELRTPVKESATWEKGTNQAGEWKCHVGEGN
jgi:hypothetical protein